MRQSGFLCGLILLCQASPATAVTPVPDPHLALHKAIYNIRLDSVSSGAGIANITGKMYFETDDACDAWTTDQRFTTTYDYADGPSILNTNHYVSWESKDGNSFQFNSSRQEDGETVELLRGSATRATGGNGTADYIRPEQKKFDLPAGYLLPTQHTNEMIMRARAGDAMFKAVMFDGTDAEGPSEMMVVIGKKITSDEIQKIVASSKEKIDPVLLVPEAWHVNLAVFPLRDTEDMTPAYEMKMVLHANGVVSAATIDYKTFRLQQDLEALEPLTPKKCS